MKEIYKLNLKPETTACNLLCEIEVKYTKTKNTNNRVNSADDSEKMVRKLFDTDILNFREAFYVIYLDRKNQPIGYYCVSLGGTVGTVVDIKLIASVALNCMAQSVIMAHNHPSGNCNPSKQDEIITTKVKNGLKLLDITVLDHIIITEDDCYSFAHNGLI